MTSAYSKSRGYKKFSVHTNTKKYRVQIVPLWRAFSKSSAFVDLFMHISVDGSRIRNNKVAFSNLSGGLSMCIFRAKGTGVNEL